MMAASVTRGRERWASPTAGTASASASDDDRRPEQTCSPRPPGHRGGAGSHRCLDLFAGPRDLLPRRGDRSTGAVTRSTRSVTPADVPRPTAPLACGHEATPAPTPSSWSCTCSPSLFVVGPLAVAPSTVSRALARAGRLDALRDARPHHAGCTRSASRRHRAARQRDGRARRRRRRRGRCRPGVGVGVVRAVARRGGAARSAVVVPAQRRPSTRSRRRQDAGGAAGRIAGRRRAGDAGAGSPSSC